MNIINSEKPNAIQLLTDGEAKTLTLALLEGAGGCMQSEELDTAMKATFEWAQVARFESAALENILRGKLLVRCGSDGEIEFIVKDSEHCEPSE